MAAEFAIVHAPEQVKVTLNGTVVKGNLLGNDATGFVKADADTVSLYAQGIALQDGVSGDVISMAFGSVTGEDTDAPYTLGGIVYTSGTAGAHTQTRPATAGQLRQAVGFAISTSIVKFNFQGLKEVTVPWVVVSATSAHAVLDSGDFGGPTLDAQNETLLLTQQVPENAVSVAKSVIRVAAEATAGTPTMDITVSSNLGDNTQWDAVAADATLVNQAREGTNADDITEISVTTGLDATNILRPGAVLGMKCLQDDAGTDISFVLGGYTVYRVA